jgi:hypothetical protein
MALTAGAGDEAAQQESSCRIISPAGGLSEKGGLHFRPANDTLLSAK